MEIIEGIKRLTETNWSEPDEATSSFHTLDGDGRARKMTGQDWAHHILQAQLQDCVPVEVRKLFEAGRGAVAYGYFFYPLFTLGMEQVFRVADAAAGAKCKALGAPDTLWQFSRRIDFPV